MAYQHSDPDIYRDAFKAKPRVALALAVSHFLIPRLNGTGRFAIYDFYCINRVESRGSNIYGQRPISDQPLERQSLISIFTGFIRDVPRLSDEPPDGIGAHDDYS